MRWTFQRNPEAPHPRERGSVLLAVLGVLAVLVIVVVALAQRVTLGSRESERAEAQRRARQHALFALNVALGQLQRHAGPDTRVTATAEAWQPDEPTSFYTGVWDTTDAAGPPRTWLVSGNEGEDPRQVLPGATLDADAVELVGAGSSLRPHAVRVPAQALVDDSGRTQGRYGWWVGDLGVKASAVPPGASRPVLLDEESSEDQRVRSQQLALDFALPGLDLRTPANAAALPQVLSFEQLSWLEWEEEPQPPLRLRALFHDWSKAAAGVLANTLDEDPATAGLRRDLSLDPSPLGAALAARLNVDAYLEQPSAPQEPRAVPAIGPDSRRRRHVLQPVVEAEGLAHGVAPVLSLFLLQFNVRTVDGRASSDELEVRARAVMSLWNPYSSALVPEPLWLEVEGLPTVEVADANGGRTFLPLQELFGGSGAMRLALPIEERNTAFRGDPDDQSWLPGRVYSWRTYGGDAASGWQTEFYHRTLSVANEDLWTVASGRRYSPPISGSVTFSLHLPPATLQLRLRRARDNAVLATYRSPRFEAPTPVPAYRDNEYRFGFPFRLVESYDTLLTDPGWWLKREGGFILQAEPPAEIFRPFGSGGADPTLYVGNVAVSAPERLLDRVMGNTGKSYDEDVPLFELPRQPVLSLGQLQHVPVVGRRPFAIGNPWAGEWNRVFDQYFLSGLSAVPGGQGPELRLAPQLDVVSRSADGTRWTPVDLQREAAAGLSSRHLLLRGSFNVNSVRAGAWEALLGAVRFPASAPWTYVASQPSTGAPASDTASGLLAAPDGAFLRFSQSAQETFQAGETGGLPRTWLFRRGVRALTQAEKEGLAHAIAAGVAERQRRLGPFRTVAEFLSGVEGDGFAGRSVIEVAIEDAGLNDSVNEFSSQYLTQADVISAIAPFLFARSDTFLIRTFGEAGTASAAGPVSRAWGEAMVQRYPEPVARETLIDDPTEGARASGPFGRRFRVIAFRWLHASEL